MRGQRGGRGCVGLKDIDWAEVLLTARALGEEVKTPQVCPNCKIRQAAIGVLDPEWG